MPDQGIYVLSMHNMPDNRLTPDFIKLAVSLQWTDMWGPGSQVLEADAPMGRHPISQMLPALDHIELHFRQAWEDGTKPAALVLTGETTSHKFFSNGL